MADEDVVVTRNAVFAGAGSKGIVPDPTVATGKFLKDDGTWDTGGGAVDSVFGRTGVVVAAQDDYSHSQLSGINSEDHHKAFEMWETDDTFKSGAIEVRDPISYVNGGITVTWDLSFANNPVITVTLGLRNLADSVYPLHYKLTGIGTASITVKVYKSTMVGGVLTFEECATDDVWVIVSAFREI